MGKCVNEVRLFGNVGKAPEVAVMPGGGKVANIRLATSYVFTDRHNVRKEETEWHSLTAYGRLAEIVEEYVTQGARLLINRGRLKTRSWDGPDGQKRYRTEIVIEDLVLIDGAKEKRYTADEPHSEYDGKF